MCAEAAEIMRDIGMAIQFLHSQNIAHRDVKVRLEDPGWGTKGGGAIRNPQWLPVPARRRSDSFKAPAPAQTGLSVFSPGSSILIPL